MASKPSLVSLGPVSISRMNSFVSGAAENAGEEPIRKIVSTKISAFLILQTHHVTLPTQTLPDALSLFVEWFVSTHNNPDNATYCLSV